MFKPVDLFLLIPALGLVIASFFFVYSGKSSSIIINIKSDSGEWVFPADTAETVKVSGPLGDTIITINNGAARITASPCMNQTCVASGKVCMPGQWAACLPNRIMLYAANDNNEIDAAVW